MDILAVAGSPRRGSNSARIAEEILAGAEAAGASTHLVRLRDYTFSSCVGCERCRKDKSCTRFHDGMTLLYPLLEAARGLVLVSPVHNYNVSALMKAFIDRLYCYYDFTNERPRGWSSRLAGQGRAGVAAWIGEQPDSESMGVADQALTLPLAAIGYEVVERVEVMNVFDAGRVADDAHALGAARAAGEKLAAALAPR